MLKKIKNVIWLIAPFCLYLFLCFRIKDEKDRAEKRILILPTTKIGDFVCTTPVYREIKKKLPNSFLAVAITEDIYGLVKNNPYIDEIIFIDDYRLGLSKKLRFLSGIRKYNFNWAVNLAPTFNYSILPIWLKAKNRVTCVSAHRGLLAKIAFLFNNFRLEYKIHTSKSKHNLELLKFLGIKYSDKKKELFVPDKENKKAKDFLRINGVLNEELIIGISVTAGNKFKEWGRKKFAKLADMLASELGARVIFLGTKADLTAIGEVVEHMKFKPLIAAGKFKLEELPGLIKNLSLFISVDTGPIYIAEAVGTPTIDIAGPVDITEQPPVSEKNLVIQKKIDCVPCSFVTFSPRYCKRGDYMCLKLIKVEDVFEAVKTLTKVMNNSENRK